MNPFTSISDVFYVGQYTNPFDLGAVVLAGCALFVGSTWSENFGSSDASAGASSKSIDDQDGAVVVGHGDNSLEDIELEESTSASQRRDQGQGRQENANDSNDNDFQKAWQIMKTDKDVRSLALMSGFFESSMFIFVFLWTPAIMQANEGPEAISSPPFGLVFALFMLGCMAGSCLFSHLTSSEELAASALLPESVAGFLNRLRGPEPWETPKIALLVFVLSTFAHFVAVVCKGSFFILLAFVLFEIAVGMYFPSMGMLKSKVVPESCRSTLYNFFRVPLNFIVCCVLLSNVPVTLGFTLTTCMLATCVYLLWAMFGSRVFGNHGAGAGALGRVTAEESQQVMDEP